MIKKQSDRGAIGFEMTGEVTRVTMPDWDEVFLEKCVSAGLDPDMYEGYVDDKTLITKIVHRGWRFDSKTQEWCFHWIYGYQTRTMVEKREQLQCWQL